MASKTDSARAVVLALERPTGTVIVDGDEVGVSYQEFALLLALSARPGEPIHIKKLISDLWPDTSTMAPQDVYQLAARLRDRLGEAQQTHRLIVNQRGRGYLLNLRPEQVAIVDSLDELEADPVVTQDPEPDQTEAPPVVGPITTASNQTQLEDSSRSPRHWSVRPTAIAFLVVMAIASSWSAGYLISTRLGSQRETAVPPRTDKDAGSSVADPDPTPRERRGTEPRKRREASKKSRKAGKPRSQDQPTAVAAAPGPAAPAPPSSQSGSGGQAPKTQTAKEPKPSAPLPPPPTRFLYHLVNAETGDHFVTTDGNVASQYHARGYEGGAIGRVYTSAVQGTRAISTNHGTAYIFIEANPKTEPASRAVALWYSTNNAGDFFYTTSEAEAKQSGWSARVVGYIGAS